MKTRLRSFLALAALLSSVSCDKPAASPAAIAPNSAEMEKTQAELAAARDALQRQALEIETRSALMEKQLAEMEKAVKEQENASLRGSLDTLKKQNDELRAQADSARRQSSVHAPKVTPLPRLNPAPVVSTARDYSLFYDRLAPYGCWLDVSGYGYCWRPTITTPRWRPYVDGCWGWSSLGWTWQSNEPFGWATYHYGRWVNLSRHGWVWVPGHEWAPAWVSWRQSREYIGWAPLPPDRSPCSGVYRDCDSHYNLGPSSYTFITTNHFTQPTYTTVCAPVTRNTTIFQSSVNVTQIVRCDDQPCQNVFKHHGGPPRMHVEQACARPVPQVQLQTASVDQLSQPQPGHHREPALEPPVIIDLPAAKSGVPPIRPQIADHIDEPKPVDAFEGVPQQVAREIRQTIVEDKVAAEVQQPLPVVVSQPSSSVAELVVNEKIRPAIAVDEKAAAVTPPAFVALQASTVTTPAETRPEPLPNVMPVAVSIPEPQPTPVPAVMMPAQPVITPEKKPVVNTPMPVVAAEPVVQTTAAVEKMIAEPPAAEALAAEAEKARLQAAAEQNQREQAEAAAMQQRQQDELAAHQRAAAEKMALEQAQAVEAELARQQAEAAAMQQRQQEEQAAQQRALAEKMAAEQAQAAAAEAERARQQAEAAAMQRQQEEAERRVQEMARQQAEEAARRAQEEQIRQQQEMAQRRAEEQMRAQQETAQRAAQEMAQRQAEEQARRAAEEQMRRAQEEAQRAAQEAAQRAAEEARRQAEEAARRAAEEAALNQPPPQSPGS
jgi:hypothetical protein